MAKSKPVRKTLAAGAIITAIAAALSLLRPAEHTLLDLTNTARTSHGLHQVSPRSDLIRFARHHSRQMAADGYLWHSTMPFRSAKRGCKGEIIGVGGTPQSIYDAFMHSTEHRDIIETGCYTRIGIGVIKRNGRYWVTEVFAG